MKVGLSVVAVALVVASWFATSYASWTIWIFFVLLGFVVPAWVHRAKRPKTKREDFARSIGLGG